MQCSLEQRMAIKFCVKLEKSAAETIPMLKKAFGVDCLSDRQIFRWHKAFAEGREDVNDDNRAGRPSTSSSDDNVKRVRDLLNTDRRLSVRLISETLDITKTFVHEIVSKSLGMRKHIIHISNTEELMAFQHVNNNSTCIFRNQEPNVISFYNDQRIREDVVEFPAGAVLVSRCVDIGKYAMIVTMILVCTDPLDRLLKSCSALLSSVLTYRGLIAPYSILYRVFKCVYLKS
ncbi:hypothetical protein NQ318_001671 [Aromia moschata]|uniref:Mos1 transposase HTH domain-containing protein n=1 Tax=Aromia moschata TaxID=1265417 RepID=A0AAV8XG01_9CUCU|nr:hypothetical protein NQ318_001671 [Aromia moschata]